ncbi:MAG: hypothetical protein OXI81_08160 [Paracoccaceae bacterium]|nr:hypothetical protein [Paracoccaceae bacterium]MDE2911854.1 hypothetical protein [Paracoccaceae bacterium]
MPDREPTPDATDDVSWSDRMTECDDRCYETNVRLLDADKASMTRDDGARPILGIPVVPVSPRNMTRH